MKTLIATVLALSTLTAFSATIPLLETTDFTDQVVASSYGINEEMGRAWVELSVDTGPQSSDSMTTTDTKIKVPGMSLVGGQVVLAVDGQQVVCANVRPVGIFHYHVAKPTGNCKFVTKTEKKIVDDGFETRRVLTLSVSLVTK